MSFLCPIQVGQVVSNQVLMEVFQCDNSQGIRPSKATKSIVILTLHGNRFYEDQWIGDIIYYTGVGKTGDQTADKGRNKSLKNAKADGRTIHLFEMFHPGSYTYQGIAELAGPVFMENQKDETGTMRKVCVFPIQIVNQQRICDEIQKRASQETARITAVRLSLKELEHRVNHIQRMRANARSVSCQEYSRNPLVSELAKRYADGICQLCRLPAPFQDKEGHPYLESHHIQWLSRNGPDTIENSTALCPNCHRKMHILDLQEDIQALKLAIQGR